MKKIYVYLLILLSALCLFSCATTQNNLAEEDASAGEKDTVEIIKGEGLVNPTSDSEAMSLYLEGTELMYAERYKEAEPLLRKAIETDPSFVDAIDHLALTVWKLGKTEEAKELAGKSISLNPANGVPYQLLCGIYEYDGDYQAAFDICAEAMNNCPDNPEGYFNDGVILMMCEQYEDAISFIYQSMSLYLEMDSPLLLDAVQNLSICYFYIGDWDNCIKWTSLYLEYDPSNETMQNYNAAAKEGKARSQ